MKKTLSYILVISFVLQIGNSIAIGRIFEKIIYEVYSYYNIDTEKSVLDFFFKEGLATSTQNQEEIQKNLSNELYYLNGASDILSPVIESFSNLYIAQASQILSGFYFALIQPPD